MNDSTRPRAFPPTPELATDAELSGLFRLLEEGDRLDGFTDSTTGGSPDRGACAAAGIHNCGVLLVPDRPLNRDGDGGEASEPPFRLTVCDRPFDARTVRAFARMARAVAAELNR